jgi:hypothetical protein
MRFVPVKSVEQQSRKPGAALGPDAAVAAAQA